MIINIEGLEVIFPYSYIYPEQYRYMCELKHGIDAKGHLLLEMPSGTGKTIALLALVVAYRAFYPDRIAKLIYCTRTVPEMEKVLEELRRLMQYRKHIYDASSSASTSSLPFSSILGIGLSARINLCIHPVVTAKETGQEVDSACRTLTASWIRDALQENSSAHSGCTFYSSLEDAGENAVIPPGVYTLFELKQWGAMKGWCPYYLARRAVDQADVVIYNYAYQLDPKIANIVSSNLPSNCVVVFDEAHNIDSECIEVLSITLTEHAVAQAEENLAEVQRRFQDAKKSHRERLEAEYKKLVEGLALAGIPDVDRVQGVPVAMEDLEQECVPGSMRRGEHFLFMLGRILTWLKSTVFTLDTPQIVTSSTFLLRLKEGTLSELKPLKFCSERLQLIMSTLEIAELYQFRHLSLIADFATLLATHGMKDGFRIVFEPYDERNPQVRDPVLQLACLDASLAIRHIFDKYACVILTSGTLSPLAMYTKLLGFHPLIATSFEITLPRNCLCPIVVTRGADQVQISSKYEVRTDPAVVRNFGSLLLELTKCVPDGLICFFTSYGYMQDVVRSWHHSGVLTELTKYKLIFIETQNVVETAMALQNYRTACDTGRGAIFMSIARGKVAEGVDFDSHYGRCVIMFGVPYVNTESKVLKERFKWLETNLHVQREEFLSFDALRHASQVLGRVIRNKTDYGLMVMADKRFNRTDIQKKLPVWIQKYLSPYTLNLSTDVAVQIAKKFFREMAQPWKKHEGLWKEQDVNEIRTRFN